MFYGEKFTDEMQLKATSKQVYYGGQLKGIEFLDRYPTEQEFSAAHAGTSIDFDPAVWKSSEIQKVLCDLAMHDAYKCEGECLEHGQKNALCDTSLQCATSRV